MKLHAEKMQDFKKRESGFSLVELMIALVIGLLIVLGAGQLFLTSKQSYNQMEALAERQEALRAITDLISLDIRTSSDITDNSADQSVLHMSYGSGVRENDPYCAGANKLNDVTYSFADQDLQVQVVCGSASSGGSLVNGIESMQFALDPSLSAAEGLFVKVEVTFPAIMSGEPVSKRKYSFMVARRNNILH
ncbi:PilW family protein [Halomonas stenophila]|uniref:Prepilin-type N-terminal cleavage/methylation domain-containing protein n=1 Tax=Halomonas stenophila TaxID=795312 RepID=A0A7W5EUW0_9GAMM|nr:prepilin-type N-terminal cleavage/methylation domain-containing protein [Halomonas stenophila]MBB3231872.1 prepilin-type N-terminal cleavage/methylation domain-containing protein [Halomonas stenophila]